MVVRPPRLKGRLMATEVRREWSIGHVIDRVAVLRIDNHSIVTYHKCSLSFSINEPLSSYLRKANLASIPISSTSALRLLSTIVGASLTASICAVSLGYP